LKIKKKTGLPQQFIINNAYPNPFNPSTTISYGLPKNSHVKITVYDIRGRLVTTLQDGNQNAGYHRVKWNTQSTAGRAVSSGIYVYRIEAGEFTGVGKLVYLR
jgi:flagellar hook assembly protein FlgD